MAYATALQVAAEAKLSGGFSEVTNPTATKAAEILAEVEAKLNARLSLKYTMPASQAANILLLRGIVLALCVERVREIMEVRSGAASVEQIQWKTTADTARKDIDAIVAGTLPLPGETLASSYDGVKSNAVTSGAKAVFKKGCQQW